MKSFILFLIMFTVCMSHSSKAENLQSYMASCRDYVSTVINGNPIDLEKYWRVTHCSSYMEGFFEGMKAKKRLNPSTCKKEFLEVETDALVTLSYGLFKQQIKEEGDSIFYSSPAEYLENLYDKICEGKL